MRGLLFRHETDIVAALTEKELHLSLLMQQVILYIASSYIRLPSSKYR